VDALIEAARDYDWPGNVRELENLIERLVGAAAGGSVDPQQALREWVPELFSPPAALRAARRAGTAPAIEHEAADDAAGERRALERVLAECGGNRAAAAARLGISRTTLWRRLTR
jgi:propionate catabolism operon transcriptional regulator